MKIDSINNLVPAHSGKEEKVPDSPQDKVVQQVAGKVLQAIPADLAGIITAFSTEKLAEVKPVFDTVAEFFGTDKTKSALTLAHEGKEAEYLLEAIKKCRKTGGWDSIQLEPWVSKLTTLDREKMSVFFDASSEELCQILLFIRKHCPNIQSMEDLYLLPMNDKVLGILTTFPLRKLRLTHSENITKEGVKQLQELHHIEHLEIFCIAPLQEEYMAAIGTLLTLTHLGLHYGDGRSNQKRSFPVSLPNLQSAHLFGFNDESMQGFVAACPNVRELHFSNFSDGLVTKVGIQHLAGLNELTRLNLSHLDITDETVEELVHVPKLSDVDLSSNHKLTDKALIALGKIRTLVRLDISRCQHITNRGIRALRPLQELRELNIDCSPQVSDVGFCSLADMKALTHLKAGWGPQCTDELLEVLAELPELTYLQVGGSKRVTEEGVIRFLNAAPKIQHLGLGVTAVQPDSLKKRLSTIPRDLSALNIFYS